MSLLGSLIGAMIFCALYYGLWVFWCRYAPQWLGDDTPQWVKRPKLWVFVLVTFAVLIVYRKSSR